MNKADIFAVILNRNQDSIGAAIAGILHKERILQLTGESNCMNWVAGHIVYTAMDCYSVIAKVTK